MCLDLKLCAVNFYVYILVYTICRIYCFMYADRLILILLGRGDLSLVRLASSFLFFWFVFSIVECFFFCLLVALDSVQGDITNAKKGEC